MGSSPLARGLPEPLMTTGIGLRIIPARAGFTHRPLLWLWGCRDHPRSRGVYPKRRMVSTWSGGSSPLARGLRRLVPALTASMGIIPARAGFTGHRGHSPSRGPDHPRSRGVYRSATPEVVPAAGSSPLARGLPRPFQRCPAKSRIIPARAGFTSIGCDPHAGT